MISDLVRILWESNFSPLNKPCITYRWVVTSYYSTPKIWRIETPKWRHISKEIPFSKPPFWNSMLLFFWRFLTIDPNFLGHSSKYLLLSLKSWICLKCLDFFLNLPNGGLMVIYHGRIRKEITFKKQIQDFWSNPGTTFERYSTWKFTMERTWNIGLKIGRRKMPSKQSKTTTPPPGQSNLWLVLDKLAKKSQTKSLKENQLGNEIRFGRLFH